MINIIYAVNQTTWDFLKQNFQYDEEGNRLRTDLTNSQAIKLRTNVHGYWKTPVLAGTTYHVVSWYVPEILVEKGNPDAGLTWVEFLLNKWPGKFHIIGAWNFDGSMFGTKLTKVPNGTTPLENINRVVTFEDIQAIDVKATMEAGVEIFKPSTKRVVTNVPTGTFKDMPLFDEVVSGTPGYPIHNQYLSIFPDVDGQPAVVPAPVNTMFGQADRRWS